MKIYKILKESLHRIEETLTDNPTADKLAGSHYISSGHLQRLFKASFGMTIASYIRSRRLAASLEPLTNTNLSVLDIAVEYGFNQAQSYTRAFKQEFGMTPGELRRTGQIVNVKPPIQLFPSNELAGGLLFGPEIVYVPEFHCVGKRHLMQNENSLTQAPKAAKDFWFNDKAAVSNILNPTVYIGLTMLPRDYTGYTHYIPSVCVSDLSDIPHGLEGNTFPSGLCVKFRYIGEHHYMDIDVKVAKGMYEAIWSFEMSTSKYGMYKHGVFFERIDVSEYDGKYCKMEWFSPVYEKNVEKSST